MSWAWPRLTEVRTEVPPHSPPRPGRVTIRLSPRAAPAKKRRAECPTVLGIDRARFTINGKPTFLLGISYYGALGASEDFLRRDLDDLQRLGFNWLRSGRPADFLTRTFP